MISHLYTCIANDLLKYGSKYTPDYILTAPLIKVFEKYSYFIECVLE